ncbi:MAG: hypothetical protein ACOYK6_06435 [Chthoniobacterales bacterium]
MPTEFGHRKVAQFQGSKKLDHQQIRTVNSEDETSFEGFSEEAMTSKGETVLFTSSSLDSVDSILNAEENVEAARFAEELFTSFLKEASEGKEKSESAARSALTWHGNAVFWKQVIEEGKKAIVALEQAIKTKQLLISDSSDGRNKLDSLRRLQDQKETWAFDVTWCEAQEAAAFAKQALAAAQEPTSKTGREMVALWNTVSELSQKAEAAWGRHLSSAPRHPVGTMNSQAWERRLASEGKSKLRWAHTSKMAEEKKSEIFAWLFFGKKGVLQGYEKENSYLSDCFNVENDFSLAKKAYAGIPQDQQEQKRILHTEVIQLAEKQIQAWERYENCLNLERAAHQSADQKLLNEKIKIAQFQKQESMVTLLIEKSQQEMFQLSLAKKKVLRAKAELQEAPTREKYVEVLEGYDGLIAHIQKIQSNIFEATSLQRAILTKAPTDFKKARSQDRLDFFQQKKERWALTIAAERADKALILEALERDLG